MDNESRVQLAETIKATIQKSKPVLEWGFAVNVWTSIKGDVRVYVNDSKRKAAAIIIIDQDGIVRADWLPGHSMTRCELKSILALPR